MEEFINSYVYFKHADTVRWTYSFRYYDSSNTRELGWKPKIPLEESLKRAIAYYRTLGVIK